jgi:hypothetical protein
MTQQNTSELALGAIEAVSELIDELAGDGRGLSMAQVNEGMDVVLALGGAEAALRRLDPATDGDAALKAALALARDSLLGGMRHIASYRPTGELAGDVADVTYQTGEALAAIAADLV